MPTDDIKITNTPYDDVFRTLLNDCSSLIIPLINEVFGEQYSGSEKIKNHLEDLQNQKVISEYIKCTIIDMSNKVLEHIAAKYTSVREGVKSVMGGKILEYEAKTIKKEGMAEGMEKGIRGTVSILKNMGIPPQTILLKIQEQYHLSPEASKKYL